MCCVAVAASSSRSVSPIRSKHRGAPDALSGPLLKNMLGRRREWAQWKAPTKIAYLLRCSKIASDQPFRHCRPRKWHRSQLSKIPHSCSARCFTSLVAAPPRRACACDQVCECSRSQWSQTPAHNHGSRPEPTEQHDASVYSYRNVNAAIPCSCNRPCKSRNYTHAGLFSSVLNELRAATARALPSGSTAAAR